MVFDGKQFLLGGGTKVITTPEGAKKEIQKVVTERKTGGGSSGGGSPSVIDTRQSVVDIQQAQTERIAQQEAARQEQIRVEQQRIENLRKSFIAAGGTTTTKTFKDNTVFETTRKPLSNERIFTTTRTDDTGKRITTTRTFERREGFGGVQQTGGIKSISPKEEGIKVKPGIFNKIPIKVPINLPPSILTGKDFVGPSSLSLVKQKFDLAETFVKEKVTEPIIFKPVERVLGKSINEEISTMGAGFKFLQEQKIEDIKKVIPEKLKVFTPILQPVDTSFVEGFSKGSIGLVREKPLTLSLIGATAFVAVPAVSGLTTAVAGTKLATPLLISKGLFGTAVATDVGINLFTSPTKEVFGQRLGETSVEFGVFGIGAKAGLASSKFAFEPIRITRPTRLPKKSKFVEFSEVKTIGGKTGEFSIFKISGEVKPPTIRVETTRLKDFFGLEPIKVLRRTPAKPFTTYTPEPALKTEPFSVREVIGEGIKFKTIDGIQEPFIFDNKIRTSPQGFNFGKVDQSLFSRLTKARGEPFVVGGETKAFRGFILEKDVASLKNVRRKFSLDTGSPFVKKGSFTRKETDLTLNVFQQPKLSSVVSFVERAPLKSTKAEFFYGDILFKNIKTLSPRFGKTQPRLRGLIVKRISGGDKLDVVSFDKSPTIKTQITAPLVSGVTLPKLQKVKTNLKTLTPDLKSSKLSTKTLPVKDSSLSFGDKTISVTKTQPSLTFSSVSKQSSSTLNEVLKAQQTKSVSGTKQTTKNITDNKIIQETKSLTTSKNTQQLKQQTKLGQQLKLVQQLKLQTQQVQTGLTPSTPKRVRPPKKIPEKIPPFIPRFKPGVTLGRKGKGLVDVSVRRGGVFRSIGRFRLGEAISRGRQRVESTVAATFRLTGGKGLTLKTPEGFTQKTGTEGLLFIEKKSRRIKSPRTGSKETLQLQQAKGLLKTKRRFN